MASPEEFLQQQTTQYQHHTANKKKVTQLLEHQQNIKTYKTIPKHYFPPSIPKTLTDNPALTREFQEQYEQLFFQHLDKTILSNTITLELENARLEQILSHTEKHLAVLPIPSDICAKLYHKFLTTNNITNHETSPQLLNKLPPGFTTETTNSAPTQPPSTNPNPLQTPPKKRKRSTRHYPKTKKQQRLNTFLAKRLPNPPPPA